MIFHWFLLDFECVFWGLVMVVGKSWKQRFCKKFYVKSQIPRVCRLSVCVFWHIFSESFLGRILSFWVFFGVTFGLLLVPKVALVALLEASKNDAAKKLEEF